MMRKLLLILLIILLSSCSSVRKKDGAPNFYVDETKIPNAVPKAEPRAKYGNMPSYRVFGKRYYTMKSSRNYSQVGTASWYGTQFHDQRTSSGEKYDMLGMTAAHKTLPLPTYVEVTNLKNNRKIIVKVNDRGPFASNRIIDLSYVAAKKLGMMGRGTAYVRVKAIDPYSYNRNIMIADNRRSSRNTNRSGGKAVYFQVGAFRNKFNAQKFKDQLANLLSSPINISDPSYQSSLYRVQIGPIRDMARVNAVTQQLRRLGIKSSKTYGA